MTEPAGRPPTVLLVTGFGRSGTTLVNTVLGATPGVFAAGEVRFLWQRGLVEQRRCGCGEPVASCPVWKAVLDQAFGGPGEVDTAALIAEDARVTRTRHLPLLAVDRATAGRLGRARVADRLDLLPEALSRLYRAIADEIGDTLIVDTSKPPSFAAVLAQVPGIDLRILHVVRDPRAVAYSWQRMKDLDDGASATHMQRLSPVEAAVQWTAWNAATGLLWGGRRGFARVRYEDLVTHPRRAFRSILAFAGRPELEVPFVDDGHVEASVVHAVAGNADRMRTGTTTIQPDTAWRTGLAPRDRRTIAALSAPVLAHYGYSLRVHP